MSAYKFIPGDVVEHKVGGGVGGTSNATDAAPISQFGHLERARVDRGGTGVGAARGGES